jgi:hypothetical protein
MEGFSMAAAQPIGAAPYLGQQMAPMQAFVEQQQAAAAVAAQQQAAPYFQTEEADLSDEGAEEEEVDEADVAEEEGELVEGEEEGSEEEGEEESEEGEEEGAEERFTTRKRGLFRRVGRAMGRAGKKVGRAVKKGLKKVGKFLKKVGKKFARVVGKGAKQIVKKGAPLFKPIMGKPKNNARSPSAKTPKAAGGKKLPPMPAPLPPQPKIDCKKNPALCIDAETPAEGETPGDHSPRAIFKKKMEVIKIVNDQ